MLTPSTWRGLACCFAVVVVCLFVRGREAGDALPPANMSLVYFCPSPPIITYCDSRYMHAEGMKLAARYRQEEAATAEELKVGLDSRAVLVRLVGHACLAAQGASMAVPGACLLPLHAISNPATPPPSSACTATTLPCWSPSAAPKARCRRSRSTAR